jgi:FixJ family two-component response regulator
MRRDRPPNIAPRRRERQGADRSLRDALTNLFRSVGLRSQVFGSAPELLRSKLPDVPGCLVLDIRLRGPSGLDFQTELAKANIP